MLALLVACACAGSAAGSEAPGSAAPGAVTLHSGSGGTVLRVREGALAQAYLSSWTAGTLFLETSKPSIASVVNASLLLDHAGGNLSVGVRGVFVGKTRLEAWRRSGNGTRVRRVAALDVHTLRTATGGQLSRAFSFVLAIMQTVNTFIMGLQLEWPVLVQIFKRPISPLIGFCCQFGLMPPIAFGWGSLFLRDDPSLHFGYFAVGCSPGGGPSNAFSLLLRGNIDLSIAMTFISNVAALGMMPAWIYSLGRVITDRIVDGNSGAKVTIPFKNMVGSLAILIVPVFLGLLFKRWKPNWAAKSGTLARVSSFLMIIILLPLGIYTNLYAFQLITWRTIVCGFCLPYSGCVISYALAKLFRRDSRDAKTIAIETMFQNAGIAIVLLQFSLPEPDRDLARVLPLCVLLFTPLPLIILLVVQTVRDRLKARRQRPQPAAPDDDKGDTGGAEGGKGEYELDRRAYASQHSPADSGTGTISTSPSSYHLPPQALEPSPPASSHSPPPASHSPPAASHSPPAASHSPPHESEDTHTSKVTETPKKVKAGGPTASGPSPWKSRTLQLYSDDNV